jgi:hypothetical protein
VASWLFRTAQREAWHLDRERYEARSLDAAPHDGAHAPEPPDARDRFRERDELEAAVDVLERLPPRLRRMAFLRATGHRYSEIQEITGDSRTRVSALIRRANEHIREALDELEASELPSVPRAERLRELESAPPQWLRQEIGRPPRGRGGREGPATRLLNWRRAALAIEDYRALTGYDSDVLALGARPAEDQLARAFDAATRAVDTVLHERGACREMGD